MKCYIFSDYFHDSIIHKITISDKGRFVVIELSCEREWLGQEREKCIFDSRYLYKLTFENARHIEYRRDNVGEMAEYINGRFKISAELNQIVLQTRKKFHHLRIQLADGFLDLIFNKFTIEKAEGEIKLPPRIKLEWHFDWVKERFGDKDVDEIRSIAECGEFPLRGYALEYLWLIKDNYCCNLAIKALDDEDAWINAVFILGEIGSINEVPLLMKIINRIGYEPIIFRHINDSIEKILFRGSCI